MMFIYLDESGDLGFDFTKSKTTRKFVITILVCYDETGQKQIRKAVKRTLKNKLNKRNKPRKIQELKGTNTTIEIKEYFFKQLKNSNLAIYTLVLNKNRVQQHLQNKEGKSRLYNYLAKHLLEKLPLRTVFTNVRLIVDRSKNREEILDFNKYIKDHIEAMLPLNTEFKIEHLTSQESGGLQAVDLFCWGIARKYERGDTQWYQVFKDKIKYETEYLREM